MYIYMWNRGCQIGCVFQHTILSSRTTAKCIMDVARHFSLSFVTCVRHHNNDDGTCWIAAAIDPVAFPLLLYFIWFFFCPSDSEFSPLIHCVWSCCYFRWSVFILLLARRSANDGDWWDLQKGIEIMSIRGWLDTTSEDRRRFMIN